MKYLFLLLILATSVLGYIYFEKPYLWNNALGGLKALPQGFATNSPASDTSTLSATSNGGSSSTSTSSDTSSSGVASNDNLPFTVIPRSTNPSGAEIITPDTILPDTGHVKQVLQPGEKSFTGPKTYVAPDPLPAQANWKWTMTDASYTNVKVLKADADSVSISYDGGAGTLEMSDLPNDIQKLLNYDPDLAATSVRAKAEAQAKVEAEKAREMAAELEAKKKQLAAQEAADAQRKKDEEARQKAQVAVDQAKQALPTYQDDLSFVTKHVSFNPTTGEIHGDPYFLKKYSDDKQQIAHCNQVIASAGK